METRLRERQVLRVCTLKPSLEGWKRDLGGTGLTLAGLP